MEDLQKARNLLDAEGYTCVLRKGDCLHTSRRRGVQPLMELLGEDLSGFSAADKVVGKATALLYCLLKVKAVYAAIISEAALEVFSKNGIPVQWEQKVPFIVNRDGTGRCPMELATEHISDPALAPDAICRKLEELKG